jgi:hypothetical protein
MKESLALSHAKVLLESKGFAPQRITQKMYPDKKIPDYRVHWGQGGLFFCEVKSPELIMDPPTQLFKHTTTMSKLTDFLHTAAKQFNSVNAHHLVPNVLIWVSDHMQLNHHNLIECVEGKISCGHQVIRDLSREPFVLRTDEDWRVVDIHIWLQVGNVQIIQQTNFINGNAGLIAITTRLFHLLTT